LSGIGNFFERIGRATVAAIEEVGNGGVLVVQSVYWVFVGAQQR